MFSVFPDVPPSLRQWLYEELNKSSSFVMLQRGVYFLFTLPSLPLHLQLSQPCSPSLSSLPILIFVTLYGHFLSSQLVSEQDPYTGVPYDAVLLGNCSLGHNCV